mmetsp:Transcript_2968/g.6722  ORF Transcript_2968/g.6722 Transcript_2968/m.6722 type:complete len:247 (+) Transcript_2968:153-893(+)
MARSLCCRPDMYTSTSTPCFAAIFSLETPQEATSGSVYVHRGTTISESFLDGALTGRPLSGNKAVWTAMPAMVPDMCVNRVSGRSMTSPMARMSGLEVVRSSSTLMPTPGVYSTPAVSKPRPSTFGTLPAAIRRASPTTVLSTPSTEMLMRISGQPCFGAWAEVEDMPEILHPVWIRMPSSSNTSRSNLAASSSSKPMIWGATSKTVTSLPNRWNACAISKLIGPAPTTTNLGGSSHRLNNDAFVR